MITAGIWTLTLASDFDSRDDKARSSERSAGKGAGSTDRSEKLVCASYFCALQLLLFCAFLSGLGGVSIELLLKARNVSFFARNLQLSLWSILIGISVRL